MSPNGQGGDDPLGTLTVLVRNPVPPRAGRTAKKKPPPEQRQRETVLKRGGLGNECQFVSSNAKKGCQRHQLSTPCPFVPEALDWVLLC